MIDSVHELIRDEIPDALDAIGFGAGAAALRSADPSNLAAVAAAVRSIPDMARDGGLSQHTVAEIESVAFWAEAAVWAAVRAARTGDSGEFEWFSAKTSMALEGMTPTH